MKHIVIDLDGTLLDDQHALKDATKAYLIELQKRGIIVSLASGRTERRMRPIIDALQLDSYCISGNGYKVFHTKRKEEYIIDTFKAEEIEYYFKILKPYELEIFTFTDTILNFYVPEHLIALKQQYKKQHGLPNDMPIAGGPYSLVFPHGKAYDEINQKDVLNEAAYKICVRGEKEQLLKIQERLKNEKCSCMVTTNEWLEICPLNNSKGNALKLLCTKTNTSLEEVVAFGDGENDLSMLSIVGRGYAMENAQPSLKQKVAFVTKSNEEEGVRLALQEIFK